jgi:arylsulfatase A-like enzyme
VTTSATSRQVPNDAATAGDIVAAAAFFALLSGLGEALTYLVQRFAMYRLTAMSPDIVWMAPVAYGVIYLPIAAGLLLLRRLRPGAVTLRSAVVAFAFLAIFAMLLPYPRIAALASAALAAGLAVQVGRSVTARESAWRRSSRRGVAVLAVGLAAATGATFAVRAWRESRGLARLPPAAPSAPNVVLLVLDTVRRSSLSTFGYGRETSPNLTRLSASGTLFDRAVATAPWTLPSHATMFTGLDHDTVVAGGWQTQARLPERALAEVFRAHGYVTGGFTANLGYTSRETGLARGFLHFDDYPVTLEAVLLHSAFARTWIADALVRSRSFREVASAMRRASLRPRRRPSWVEKPASRVTDEFLRWQATTADRPFLAFLNYFDAHEPYRAPDVHRRAFGTARPMDRYDASIAYLDAELGRLADSLAARGVLDRTILVVTADHGEQFGEHGLRGHANSLYREVLAVPLLVRYPAAVPSGRRVPTRVSLRDLAATIADLAGTSEGAGFPGTSLAPYWGPSAPTAPVPVYASVARGINVDAEFPNASGALDAVYLGDLKYIRHQSGREEVYDLATDPAEAHNLARSPDALPTLARLRAVLDSLPARSRPAAGTAAASN